MALYNLRNPAVKRLMREAEELSCPTDEYQAQPLEDNLFEWHFTIKGPPNSDYEGGIYHGRITLPPEYPMKPPSIILLTPNGRFEVNKKICLSISGHHPESWQPSWSIRTALLAIIGFMPTHGNGALGSLDYTPEERKQLALKSQDWNCVECGHIKDIFVKKGHSLSESIPPPSSPPSQVDMQQSSVNSCPTPMEQTASTVDVSTNQNVSSTNSENSSLSSSTPSTTVHHRKIASDVNETIQPQMTNPVTSKPYDIYTVCMWVIILAIALLSLRRLFTL